MSQRGVFALLLGMALAGQVMLALGEPWFRLDATLGDMLLRLEAKSRVPPEEIVLVEIDQDSLDDPRLLELVGNWPWPRAVHGELLDFIGMQAPRAVVFDLIFSEPDLFRPQSDALFEEALRRYPAYLPLVVVDGVGSRLADLPPLMAVRPGPQAQSDARLPLLAPKALSPELWRTGLINFLEDADGVGRRYWLRYPYEGWFLPALPARVAADLGVELPSAESLRLHFFGAPFTRLSYGRLYLESLKERPEGVPDLRGKIVIIGAAAPGLHDLRPTPLSGSTPGPVLLATALGNLLHGDDLRPVSSLWTLLVGIVLSLGVAWATRRKWNPLYQAGTLALLTGAAALLAYQALVFDRLWLPFSMLAGVWLYFAACALLAYLGERAARERALQLFGRFLDPRVVRTLASGGLVGAAEVGRSREISVLFSDIRGFTSLSESRSPEEIVHLLNRYFDAQVEVIFAHDGTLDKFIGDAIMAFWGAPVDNPDHAVQAVDAALDMQERLLAFQRELAESGLAFDIGIGIHTGPAVVGFLGSSRRLDYTAIGDTVNLASRIEGCTKGVARVLVSEATRLACEARAPGRFVFVDRGETQVKGREHPVRLFEPNRNPGRVDP
ncbi:MAG: adenylate/guanylate cyclase domain-containing protein [Pseudomonadota bacterium]